MVVTFGVHENELFPIEVEELHLSLVNIGLVDSLAGAEGFVDGLAVAQILDLGPDERRPFAGFDVLKIGDVK